MTPLTLDRRALLRFMNEGDKDANGHHTAITGLIGEPLAAALTVHYLESRGGQAAILENNVTTGAKAGPRLDAWISHDDGRRKVLYQTEIKMWAGNAIGGLRLPPGTDAPTLRELGERQWRRQLWDEAQETLRHPSVGKVLRAMRRPAGHEGAEVEPLLVVWWLVYPTGEVGPWSTVAVRNEAPSPEYPFQRLHVFSLSSYLMGLSEDQLSLEMPVLARRLGWLDSLVRRGE